MISNKHAYPKVIARAGILLAALIIGGFGLTNIAYADDAETPVTDKPINCKKQIEFNFDFPFGIPGGFNIEITPNQLEMPIGQAVDQTEDAATRIIDYMQHIIDAAGVEINTAKIMVDLAKLCGKPPTNPGDPDYTCKADCSWRPSYTCCPPISLFNPICNPCPDVCRKNNCGGNACPSGMPALQQLIDAQVLIIRDYKARITEIYKFKDHPPIGAWWCACTAPETIIVAGQAVPNPAYGSCIPPPGKCRSETQLILEKLEKARSGDFQVFRIVGCPEPYVSGLGGTCWYRKPPGLKDCVLRPSDFEEGAAGQKQISLPSSCRDAVASGILGQSADNPLAISTICWGNTRCLLEKEAGRTPPADWLCSGNESETEDYFCCE